MVATMPRLMDNHGTVSSLSSLLLRRKADTELQAEITNSVLEYTKFIKPHMGKTATSANKAVKYVDRPGEVCGEVQLVKGWFGIGQEMSIRTLDIQLSFLKKLKAQGCHSSLSRKFQDWWGFFQDS